MTLMRGYGLAVLVTLTAPAAAESRAWVAVHDLKRFSCPSTDCGVVGRFYFRETVPVFETANGWSRVSVRKTAGCYDGVSLYVEAGPAECAPENGITQGRFSEWVRSEYLVDSAPAKPLTVSPEAPGEG